MLFEIINPSDPYTMESDSLEVAAVAVCLLGSGAYGLKELDSSEPLEVPIFLLGGHDEWFQEKFGRTFKESADHVDAESMAKCLESVKLPEGHERGSLNDIGGRAQQYASAYRGLIAGQAKS